LTQSDDKYKPLLEALFFDSSILEFLRYNKIITTIAFLALNSGWAMPKVFLFKLQRYNIYLEEARKLAEVLEREGIEYSIIKTFSSVPKDISDIDLLVNPEHFDAARKILLRLGFTPRKKGLEQDLYSKLVDGVVVDVEIHSSIAAAGYEYYDAHHVLRRSIVFNGIRVPEPADAILILAAHDVMKDLYIPLAHILEFYLLSSHVDCSKLLAQTSLHGLSAPLSFFTLLTEFVLEEKLSCKAADKLLEPFLLNIIKILKAEPVIKVPIALVLASYINSFQSKARLKGLTAALKQIFSLPSGKGISALLRNVLPLKPEVKELWE